MFWIGDKYITLDDGESKDQPQLLDIILQYQHVDHAQKVQSIKDGEDIPYCSWHSLIQKAKASDFEHILAFLVNVPELKEVLRVKETIEEWSWESLNGKINTVFQYQDGLIKLLESQGLGKDISAGWRLYSSHGRIDEDVTWSKTAYVVALNKGYVFCEYYQEVLH